MRRGAHLVHRHAEREQVRPYDIGQITPVGYVDLVEYHHPRPVGESAVRRQLTLDRVDVRKRITTGFERGGVHHVHQYGTALDMPEEVESESPASSGTRDQPRYVGDGKRLVTRPYHAEVGYQRGERIIRDLGASRRERGDQ